jgi:hypothetical protein
MAGYNNIGMDDAHAKRSLFYSLPITIGSFFRELLAVTLLLVLQERAFSYDFFTSGLVLFLISLTFRVPYVNTYILLFESFSLGQWDVRNYVGLRKHADASQNILHVLVILAAYICGGLAAAALRVYFDVTYGTELMLGKELDPLTQSQVAPALQVNVDHLRNIDSFWGAEHRIDRLLESGVNGTISQLVPLDGNNDLGIGDTALTVWYAAEEIGYVFLFCVCYVHIWLGAGVGENKKPHLNPFSHNYWYSLFKVFGMVVLSYVALCRAFPTAHGSLHVTIFKLQYQAWNPNKHLIDHDHSELVGRIFGGFIGLFLAVGYNKMLVGTERSSPEDDPGDFYYKLIWGLEPDAAHTKARRVGRADGGDSSSDEERSHGRRKSRAYKWNFPRAGSRDDFDVSAYKTRKCERGGKGGSCMDATCVVCYNKGPDFKLRLPHTLDHVK